MGGSRPTDSISHLCHLCIWNVKLFAEFITIISSLCFVASPMQPKLEPHSTPFIWHIKAHQESQTLHAGRKEQRSTVTVPQALRNPAEQSEWWPYVCHTIQVWHLLAAPVGNPLDKGDPWMFPTHGFYRLLPAFEKTNSAAADGRGSAATGLLQPPLPFVPLPSLCASFPQMLLEEYDPILSTTELRSTKPCDDANDPADSLLFHSFMPYMQHCYGNTWLMPHSRHRDIAHLASSYSSLWSRARWCKLFSMPFLNGYTPRAKTGRSTTSLCSFPIFSPNRARLTSGYITSASHSPFPEAGHRAQPVCHQRKRVHS